MTREIVPVQPKKLARIGLTALPRLIVGAGEQAQRAFLEFFTATIRNRHTRLAYARGCARFLDWCEDRDLRLDQIEPVVVAAYVEGLTLEVIQNTAQRYLNIDNYVQVTLYPEDFD